MSEEEQKQERIRKHIELIEDKLGRALDDLDKLKMALGLKEVDRRSISQKMEDYVNSCKQ